eukprot:TRINITY_DN21983_c0_g1_i1.p1 TRINITY_DN21983_c0_g1~~TRINITY_DN21983_c0_g1_i1.p1  ORF type:complete len:296 (+),score=93.99 TRINITY_DN21983_c0_g1_i1:74-961(+)
MHGMAGLEVLAPEVGAFLDASAALFRPLGVTPSLELDAEAVLRLVALMGTVVMLWGMAAARVAPGLPLLLRKFGGNYMLVSNFVCFYIASRGAALLWAFADAPYDVQYNGRVPATATEAEAAGYTALLAHCGLTNQIFLAYMTVETLLLLFCWEEYGGRWDALLHHAVYIAGSIINHHYLSYQLVFAVLVQGEWSTPFLTARQALKACGRESAVVDAAFAAAFFVVRVVLLTYGVGHMTRSVYLDGGAPHPDMPAMMQHFVYAMLLAMYALNIYWFTIVIAKAAKFGRRPRSKIE